MRIIALFNLKPGVSHADYEAWAQSVDLPTVNALPSVGKFEVFRATGMLGSDAPPPYGFVEIIDVDDMDQFGEDIATPAMQAIGTAFQEMADVIFITTERLGA